MCKRPCFHSFPCCSDYNDYGFRIVVFTLLRSDPKIASEGIDDFIDSINEGSTVEESVDEDGNKTVTTKTITTSNEQTKISWKK